MNTASNWPMGSTLAQLNLELQTTPFATSKVSGDKTKVGLTEGVKIVSSQSTFASSVTQPMSQVITSKTGSTSDAMKWTQTR
jgi:hypothetical protein